MSNQEEIPTPGTPEDDKPDTSPIKPPTREGDEPPAPPVVEPWQFTNGNEDG